MEKIRDNQYSLYEVLKDVNRTIKTLSEEARKLNDTSKLTQYYTETLPRLLKLRKLCMLILEKSDKTRYITLGFLKWSPFFIPFSFLDFSQNVLENQQRQIAHFGNNVFVGLVIKVTFVLRERS